MELVPTILQGLRRPTSRKAIPNAQEELQSLAWKIVEAEVDRLTIAGWKDSKYGHASRALCHYKGANVYFYIIHLALIVRSYIQTMGLLNQSCNSLAAEKKYKLNCVEEQLGCLSSKYGTNYIAAWNQILAVFGIDRQTENCTECCVGISEMIINGEKECAAFIVGPEPCGTIEELRPPYGEFEPCEFPIDGVTEAEGDNLYENCN